MEDIGLGCIFVIVVVAASGVAAPSTVKVRMMKWRDIVSR